MIIINAHINQASDFDDFQTALFLNLIKTDVEKFISVSNVPDLLHALEIYRHQNILLFSNFSPDHHFKHNGIDVDKFQIEPMANWRVDGYSISASLYHHICQKYSIVGIHFITSALKRNVNDCDFFNITGGIKTTIKRKQEWLKLEVEYQILLKRYMLNEIYEAKSATSILIPNHEVLLKEPVVEFCPN